MPMIHRLTKLLVPAAMLAVAVDASGMIVAVNSSADNEPAGACTVRQAIALVNGSGNTGTCQSTGTASPPEITFSLPLPATITLDAGLGPLNPTASMLIQGPGRDQLTLSGNNQVRVFSSFSGGATLYLRDLRIANGRSPSGDAGGGINICCGFSLDLARIHVLNNHSNFAGGGIEANGNIVMRDSLVEGNTAVNDDAPGSFLTFGGGVRVSGFGDQALFERVWFLGNIAGSLVAGANPGVGGALSTGSSRTVTVVDSLFESNQARGAQQRTGSNPIPTGLGGQGGAIYNASEVNLTGSTLQSNQASFEGGGLFNVGTTQVVNTTIAHNTVPSGASPSEGGGMANAANNGSVNGPQVELALNHVTFYGNSAGVGGGLHNRRANDAQVQIRNSAFGHNGSGQTGGDLVNGGSGVLTGTHNLVESAAAAGGLVDGVDGNIVGSPAAFLGLALNGGVTATVAFDPASPLRNAADAGTCAATDQRGVARPQGAGCDIGALEYLDLLFGDRFEASGP